MNENHSPGGFIWELEKRCKGRSLETMETLEQEETADGSLRNEGVQRGPPTSQGTGLGQRHARQDLSSAPALSSRSLASVSLST